MNAVLLEFIAGEPSGRVETRGTRPVSFPLFHPSPNGARLKAHRQALHLSAPEAARRLGVATLGLLMLEAGRYTLGSEAQWAEALRRLEQG